ncbi:hypothetical protein CFREI_04610 [Corynebacterium freiburgense]|nr:hypothetical protein CFREI_04610 [Corynebacterium freiburgense]
MHKPVGWNTSNLPRQHLVFPAGLPVASSDSALVGYYQLRTISLLPRLSQIPRRYRVFYGFCDKKLNHAQ